MSNQPIIIMAGGTGGHIYPALAVAKELKARSRKVIWLGTRRGLEAKIIATEGIKIEWINIEGFRGKPFITRILAPLKICFAIIRSIRVMIKHNPSVVLGMGSFVSGPGGIAAWLLRYPLIIHEQNAIPGKTNHLLAYFANVVMESFSGSFNKRFRAVNAGNPIRKDILSIQEPSKRLIDRKGPIRLLVLGGSLGALILNQKLPKILASMSKITNLEVIHQAGEKTIDIARDEYQKYALKVKVVSYIQEMADVYNWADLVICRSGAMCVSELSAVGLPAIFIPYPSAVDNHQVANAMPLVEAGAAIIVREQEFEEKYFLKILTNWLRDRSLLIERAVKAQSFAKPHALDQITELCIDLTGENP